MVFKHIPILQIHNYRVHCNAAIKSTSLFVGYAPEDAVAAEASARNGAKRKRHEPRKAAKSGVSGGKSRAQAEMNGSPHGDAPQLSFRMFYAIYSGRAAEVVILLSSVSSWVIWLHVVGKVSCHESPVTDVDCYSRALIQWSKIWKA